MSETLSNRNVSNAMIRRSVVGDAGSLQRLRGFLVNWGIINRDAINDSAPTSASLRPDRKRSAKFNNDMRDDLIVAVTEQAAKKRKLVSSSGSLSIDWQEIAVRVGHGVNAEECQQNFMTAELKEESSDSSDVSMDVAAQGSTEQSAGVAPTNVKANGMAQQKEFIQNLVENSDPQVLKKMFQAAVQATTNNTIDMQTASLLGIHATETIANARGHEIDLAVRLSKLLDARMQKLENRMSMLDDVEGILEAEKVALEMERRDLYTARCRHWFGGV